MSGGGGILVSAWFCTECLQIVPSGMLHYHGDRDGNVRQVNPTGVTVNCLVCGGNLLMERFGSAEYPGVCDICIEHSSKIIEERERATESENPRPGIPRVK